MFPTKIAESLVTASDINKLFENKFDWKIPIGQFQRLALVADFDTAFKCLNPHINGKPSEQQRLGLSLIHEMAKSDVLSIAMERLVDTVETTRSDKERVAAATILNELFGDKELIKDVKLTDRLIINTVGEG